MATLGSLNDIKQGMTIVYNNDPYVVVEAHFVRMQQRKPVMQTKLRNLISGKVVEYNFKPGEKVDEADVGREKVNFLYSTGDEFTFMDNNTYEQFSFTREKLGDQAGFLKDGAEVQMVTFNDTPINIQLPPKVELKVVSTMEGSKGDTAQGKVMKEAELETGVRIMVPMFVKNDDIIRVNTETASYVERVN
jgi:elongation factor P